MELERVPQLSESPLRLQYSVGEIGKNDIAPPSENFIRVARNLRSYSDLNSFTIGEFSRQVQEQFATLH